MHVNAARSWKSCIVVYRIATIGATPVNRGLGFARCLETKAKTTSATCVAAITQDTLRHAPSMVNALRPTIPGVPRINLARRGSNCQASAPHTPSTKRHIAELLRIAAGSPADRSLISLRDRSLRD